MSSVTDVVLTGKRWRKKAASMAAKRAEDRSKSRLNRTAFVIPPLQVCVCVCLSFRRGAESLTVEATGMPCAIPT